jgi:hypothetical protein
VRAWILTAALAGCFSPKPQAGIACGTGGACPDPLVCAPATNTCETALGDPIDAPIDTPLATDAAACATTTHDEDGDGVVDSCDNCPGIANASQADTTEAVPDGVGDACDPRPQAKDRIALFESFASMPQGWTIDPDAKVMNDQLVQSATNGYGEAYSTKTSTAGIVQTRYHVTALDTNAAPYSSAEVVAERGPDGNGGYRCGVFQSGAGGERGVALQIYVDPYDLAGGNVGGARFTVGQSGLLTLAYGGTLTCNASDPNDKASIAEPEARTGVVGLGTQYVGIAFDYLVLYEPAN